MNERFSDQQKEVLSLLKLLDENNILPHVILAGSWAEYAYAQSGALPGFTIILRTIDVDFLIKNLRRPTTAISLPTIAKKCGYSIEHDTLMGTTKFFSPGGLEIEFLIAQRGSGVEPILETNLGVNAQALRHMEAIVANAMTVDLLGMKVQVPCPESYVLHKMLINDVRGAEKKEKDRHSVLRLLPYIDYDKLGSLYNAYSKKEKSRVRGFLEKYRDELYDQLRVEERIKFAKFISETIGDAKSNENRALSSDRKKSNDLTCAEKN